VVDKVLRPFLAGVFLEDRLDTSGRFFHLLWRRPVEERVAASRVPGW